jgi:hypothetical protein
LPGHFHQISSGSPLGLCMKIITQMLELPPELVMRSP